METRQQTELVRNVPESPQLIKINADFDSSKRVCLQWTTFFCITFILYMCTLAIPDAFTSIGGMACEFSDRIKTESENCTSPQNNTRALYVEDYQLSQMFLLVRGKIRLQGTGAVRTKQSVQYRLVVWEVKERQLKQEIFRPKTHKTEVECEEDESILVCETLTMAYLPDLDYSDVLITVELERPESFAEFYLDGITTSTGFTNFLIVLRYVFLLISMTTTYLYYRQLSKLAREHRVVEQNMVLGLSILVCFFDDPLFAITVLTRSNATAIIGVIFLSNFVASLLMFWLVTLDRMVNENGEKTTQTITVRKMLIIFILWLSAIISYAIMEVQFSRDPASTDEAMVTPLMVFKVICLLMVSIVLCWIIYNYFLFCKSYSTRLWRYKVYGLFSLYFIFCFALFIFVGSFQISQFDGTRVLLTVGVMNFYVYYLQYMWAPNKEGIQQQAMEDQIELGQQQNAVYDQLDDGEGINIVFQSVENENPILVDSQTQIE